MGDKNILTCLYHPKIIIKIFFESSLGSKKKVLNMGNKRTKVGDKNTVFGMNISMNMVDRGQESQLNLTLLPRHWELFIQ